jgi:hypothetical protein
MHHEIITRSPSLPADPLKLVAKCREISQRGTIVHNGPRVVWTIDGADYRAHGGPSITTSLVMSVDAEGQWTGSLAEQPAVFFDDEGDLLKASRLLLRESEQEHFAPVA